MSASTGTVRLRQAIGSFDDATTLDNVTKVLIDQGVDIPDLTVLTGHETLDTKLLPHVDVAKTWPLGDTVKSMSAIGAMTSAGPLLVSSGHFGHHLIACASDEAERSERFLARWLSDRHADYLHQQLDAGSVLLCVYVRNGAQEKRAGTAILKHSLHQLQIHDFIFPEFSSSTDPPSS